ncbi:MAG: S-adenosylmethionine:tRNA ribosyltransferase-isomerase, partial [Clostridia bacterium]|nr:S-adenosylmethionine:tRNA ribosyltransferase-isomerase [Clostridia bacterium]
MNTADYWYDLPEELIAQTPLEDRASSRLMVLTGRDKTEHKRFSDITAYLQKGDVLVINESAVIPARLHGQRESTGAHIEVLLLKRVSDHAWETLVRPGRRVKIGEWLTFGDGVLRGKVLANTEAAGRVIEFEYEGEFYSILDRLGEMPLPPYIHEQLKDGSRYQTVYAKEKGSAAAPTAGLHFTPELLNELREKGVLVHTVLLHVGLGTFR